MKITHLVLIDPPIPNIKSVFHERVPGARKSAFNAVKNRETLLPPQDNKEKHEMTLDSESGRKNASEGP